MIAEMKARLKHSLLCLFAKDGTWSMGADLVFGLSPWGGKWLMGQYVFDTYAEAVIARRGGDGRTILSLLPEVPK